MPVAALSGHRPDKLGGYSEEIFERLVTLACDKLTVLSPSIVISGMALGWDQAGAQAAAGLGIPFIAALPFASQSFKWPRESLERYNRLLSLATKVEIVSKGNYSSSKMQVRNVWMVDRCDTLLALWNGSFGGTYNCVHYAKGVGRTIIDCWDEWQRVILGVSYPHELKRKES